MMIDIVMEVMDMSEFIVKINEQDKRMLIESITLKLASVKRARNTNRSPAFLELYDQEMADYSRLLTTITSSK